MAESKDFLSKFHLEAGISSKDFQKIWKNYDTDENGYIEQGELENLIKDLMMQADEEVTPASMQAYKKHIMTFFDSNTDGRLDVKEMLKMFPVKDPSSSA
ncbi:calbindin-32-like [Anneissia japonica]|uniref:calbindin-32-like n=1 Tax=Anneissia japonica TaxID=1529436 RepID=UPI0014256C21|nr:calbindin-32-like [Anneissia japonica]